MVKPDENLLHLGADLDKAFVSGFRDYCRLNDFKQKTIVRRLVEWWLALDSIDQEHIYRGRLQEAADTIKQPHPTEPTIIESIETIKHFVRYKLPSTEEQREIDSLKKALGPEPKKQLKRKKA